MLLDLEKRQLTPTRIQVTPLPQPGSKVDPQAAAMEQLRNMTRLARQVPEDKRNAIFKEGNERSDLTPEQRIDWITEQFRRYIESSKTTPQR